MASSRCAGNVLAKSAAASWLMAAPLRVSVVSVVGAVVVGAVVVVVVGVVGVLGVADVVRQANVEIREISACASGSPTLGPGLRRRSDSAKERGGPRSSRSVGLGAWCRMGGVRTPAASRSFAAASSASGCANLRHCWSTAAARARLG
jgi:hypothetical protein